MCLGSSVGKSVALKADGRKTLQVLHEVANFLEIILLWDDLCCAALSCLSKHLTDDYTLDMYTEYLVMLSMNGKMELKQPPGRRVGFHVEDKSM